MKRIVICCDGTWRRLGEERPTNVAHVACMVAPQGDGARPAEQIVAHFDGVGTGGGDTWAGRALDRYGGAAFGLGLERSIAAAYRLLVFTYQPGDEIYLFGYSRGAFTARSLAGLIRQSGVLARRHAGRIGEALRLYRRRDPALGPAEPASLEFRARYAPGVALDAAEIDWRTKAYPDRDWSGTALLSIRFIGVWDTVGALGVPGLFRDKPLLHHSHQFHDQALSSHVEAARHAVAVDEKRRTFTPTLWSNLDQLNGPAGGADAPYQQRWFPGVHAAIGGGGLNEGLSSLALLWVLEGAQAQGLVLDPEMLAGFARLGDPCAPLSPSPAPDTPLSVLRPVFERDRTGPPSGRADALSDAAVQRWHRDPGYRPPTLARVRDILNGWHP